MEKKASSFNDKKSKWKLIDTKPKSKRAGMLKASKSLIDLSIFNSKKKKTVLEEPKIATSSWDVYAEVPRSGTNSSDYSRNSAPPPIMEDDTASMQRKTSISSFSCSDGLSVPGSSSRASNDSTEGDTAKSISLSSTTTDTNSKSGYKRNGLKSVSRSTPAMVNQSSHQPKDILPHLPKSTKKFHKHFSEVDKVEGVLNYYVCAYVADILHQGTLFITERYFAFYSNIFGFVNKILIPINDVTAIKKKKTASFIPNAIGIQTDAGKMYVFSSLISRENTYKFMDHMWRKSRKMLDSDCSDPAVGVQQEIQGEESHLDDSASGSGDSIPEEESDELIKKTIEIQKPLGQSVTKKIGKEKLERKHNLNDVHLSSQTGKYSYIDVMKMSMKCFKNALVESKSASFLLWSSVIAVVILLISAGYMMYRVEILTRQIDGENPINYNTVYEEVLHMQQKLHSGTAEEVEKTLGTQLKQISMIRQSLETLSYLFNKDYSSREKLEENIMDV